MATRKTWTEKLADSKDLPRVEMIPERLKAVWGSGSFVIPAPKEVDELMNKVPKGKVTTINHIREALARKHATDTACPMTTGIFSWIAANAADEVASRRKRVTPYWRTLKVGGKLNEKYPGGVTRQRRLLKDEGHRIIKRGKHYFVADVDESIFNFGAKKGDS